MEELPLIEERKDGLGYEVVAMDGDRTVEVMLRLKAPDPPDDKAGPFLAQVVLDTSEAMHPRKLFPALRGIDYLASHLREDDRIGIVTFGGPAEIILSAGPVEEGDGVRDSLRQVRPFGVADPVAGLLEGLKEAKRASGDGKGAIFLITDRALFRADKSLANRVAGVAAAAKDAGFPVTVIAMDGHGSRYLSGVARSGGGRMVATTNGGRVCEVMLEKVPGGRSERIRGLEVVVEGSEAVGSIQMKGGDQAEPYGGGVLLNVGDLRDGEVRDVLVELETEGTEGLSDDNIAALDLKWSDLGLEKAFWASMPLGGGGGLEERVLFEFPEVEVKLRQPSRVLGEGEGEEESEAGAEVKRLPRLGRGWGAA